MNSENSLCSSCCCSKWHRGRATLILSLFAGIFCFSTTLWRTASVAPLNATPNDWDGVYYDALALSLSKGNGFRPQLDASFREPYASGSVRNGSYELELAERGINSYTTYRPPLHPLWLASVYRVVGRNFVMAKAGLALLYAVGVAFMIALLARRGIGLGACVALSLFVLDPFPSTFVAGFHSELLGFVFVVALLWLLTEWDSLAPKRSWTALGVLLGVLALCRPIFIFWMLPILVWRCWRELLQGTAITTMRGVTLAVLLFLGITLPWSIRNVQLLQKFLPLGSQGPMMAGMVYNDRALFNSGNWTLEEDARFIREFDSPLVGTAREAALAAHGQELARRWLSAHPELFPALLVKRLVSLWWPPSRYDQRVLVVLAICGLFFLGRTDPIRNGCVLILVAHSFAIALTSNDQNGRLLFAVQPALVCLAALAITRLSHTLAGLIFGHRPATSI